MVIDAMLQRACRENVNMLGELIIMSNNYEKVYAELKELRGMDNG
jgi:hypothetical protein